ncbi:uncharacterized protein LOC125194683 [Salvia hispanica]|uniref:uncharacterized protein LOC125194683 n=1 Tax=Salvia hispanica TaxID=49212 RepID=UPI0020099527|nr:uncharacterized protein LOC125194683 [Salvia hispanica]
MQIKFQSLAPFKPVSPDVIDTWSSYLNTMEKSKAPETVSRLFFSTKPCIQSMVDAQPEWTEEFQFNTFWTRLLEEALGTGYFQWDKYDMFFFPVWGMTHQYVVCFNLPDCKMNIIDHSLAETHASFGEKYGNTPSVLKKFFATSLTKSKVPKMATQVRKCNAHVVTMPWRNNSGTVDTGVYVMRHMETYFGEREKDWECGLRPKEQRAWKCCE